MWEEEGFVLRGCGRQSRQKKSDGSDRSDWSDWSEGCRLTGGFTACYPFKANLSSSQLLNLTTSSAYPAILQWRVGRENTPLLLYPTRVFLQAGEAHLVPRKGKIDRKSGV